MLLVCLLVCLKKKMLKLVSFSSIGQKKGESRKKWDHFLDHWQDMTSEKKNVGYEKALNKG